MRTYVMTTGVIFGLLVIAHVLRIVGESPALAGDPSFVAITLACAVLCGWAFSLLRRRT